MTTPTHRTTALAALGALSIAGITGCTASTRPLTPAHTAANQALAPQSIASSPASGTPSATPSPPPSPTSGPATTTAAAPLPKTAPTTPAQSKAAVAPPPVMQPGPPLTVTATSTPTTVSVQSSSEAWTICISVTLHITNDTMNTLTTITLDPVIQSSAPEAPTTALLTTPANYTIVHVTIAIQHSATVQTTACGYIYNSAGNPGVTYTSTDKMIGGIATPGTQLQDLPVGWTTVTMT